MKSDPVVLFCGECSLANLLSEGEGSEAWFLVSVVDGGNEGVDDVAGLAVGEGVCFEVVLGGAEHFDVGICDGVEGAAADENGGNGSFCCHSSESKDRIKLEGFD